MRQRFFKYVFRSIAGMLGISVYILADTYFISRLSGADGLAVLNLILPVYSVIYALGALIGLGFATRYGIQKAKGAPADHYFFLSVFCSLAVSLPFVLVGIFCPARLLGLLGADAALTAMGTNYLRVILIASPFFITNYSFSGFARNDNGTRMALIGAWAGSAFNIIFDYLFMFPLGLGFTGAAFATMGSPLATMVCCAIHFSGKNSRICLKKAPFSLHELLHSLSLGLSPFMSEMSSAVTTLLFNMLILGITGAVGVAAYGVVANIAIVVMAVFSGLGQGMQPLLSEACGKGDRQAQNRLIRLGFSTVLVMEAAIVALMWLFTDPIVAIFNSEGNALMAAYAFTGVRLYFLSVLAGGINLLLIAYYSAVDRPRPAAVGAVSRGFVAITFCAVVMAKLWGMNGIWLSILAAECITLAVLVGMEVFEKR